MAATIFTNGNIYTCDDQEPRVEAIVVENGRIKDMGDSKDMLLQWARPEVAIVDLEGKTASPGLTDSHLHLSGVGLQYLDLNLTGVSSKQEMLARLREKALEVPSGGWLLGMGWDENLFTDGGVPTIEELDASVPSCPVFLKRICHHAFLVNSRAIEIAGWHPGMSMPAGGNIELNPLSRRPTGLVLESASVLFTKHIPDKTYSELKQGLAKAMDHAVSLGLTSVHTNDPKYLGGLEPTYRMYHELLNEGRRDLRCNLLVDYPYLRELKEMNMGAGYGNDTLQIGAIKIFADGAFGKRTALLSKEYADAPGEFGEAMLTQEELTHIVGEARKHSMPVSVHTIGDQALANVLEVLSRFSPVSARDRLIHVSLVNEELISKMAKPHLVADIQPRFVAADFPWIEDRLGEQRLNDVYAWNHLLTKGVLCAGGSDAPVEPLDPLLGIHAAVTRRKPGESHNGYIPGEKITVEQALRLFTVGGAYASSEERIKGTLTRGKLGDMTVYSKDLLNLGDPDELLETKAVMTIIGGHIQAIT